MALGARPRERDRIARLRLNMVTGLTIALITLGLSCAALTTRVNWIARRLWPGPTVKGPADIYVQAFQGLIVLAGLGAVVVLSSVAGLALSIRSSWSLGMWLSGLPVLALLLVIAASMIRARTKR